MSEWWTYRLEDFLLFSPRVYWRMFELHNEALWPLHFITFAAGIAIILLALWRPHARTGLWIAIILAALWAFVGWSFLWNSLCRDQLGHRLCRAGLLARGVAFRRRQRGRRLRL